MTTSSSTPIDSLPSSHHSAISKEWLADVIRVWKEHYPELVVDDELHRHAGRLLDELVVVFAAHLGEAPTDVAPTGELAATARNLGVRRDKAGFNPERTAQYVLALKNVLTCRLASDLSQSPADLMTCLTAVDDVLDRLPLLTFAAYAEVRENVVAQKSLSIIALSAPVIFLCDQLLMLPLVGVIDAPRASEFIDRMLAAISRCKVTVVLIDVTGVPEFGTSVARLIMKTVAAAQSLGTRIVMTGISPAGEQTLAALGNGFANVTSRTSLQSGVAEALVMMGHGAPLLAAA